MIAAHPRRQVTALVRKPLLEPGMDVAIGDLREPKLGLGPDCWRALSNSVTTIVHCAADIRFGIPLEVARCTNTYGLARMLEFAGECRSLEKFAHVSTVFVSGRSQGVLREDRFENEAGFFSTYEQSKYEAEQIALDAAAKLPISVFRLSSVVGHSKTGAVDQYNYFHQMLRLVPRYPLPVMPALADALVDFVATDWAVSALCALFERHFEPGTVRNLCAGKEGSMTVREVVESAFDALGRGRVIPEFVNIAEFERMAASGQRLAQALLFILPHLAVRHHFQNARTLEMLQAEGIEMPDSRILLGRIIDHCIATDWGRR